MINKDERNDKPHTPQKGAGGIIKREMLLKVVVRPQTVLNSTLPHDLVKYLEKLQAEWWNGGHVGCHELFRGEAKDIDPMIHQTVQYFLLMLQKFDETTGHWIEWNLSYNMSNIS